MKNLTFILILGLLSAQCGSESVTIKANDTALHLDNGVLYHQEAMFNGVLVSYFENGNLKSRVPYKNGRKNGREEQWYANGNQAIERFYEQGVKVDIHQGWYTNGQQQFEYHFDQEGRYHGLHKEWYQTGQLAKNFNFTNGKEDGHQRLWKPDGSIKANFKVRNSERFGLIGLKKCNTVTANSQALK